jgi:hypothetical protein
MPLSAERQTAVERVLKKGESAASIEADIAQMEEELKQSLGPDHALYAQSFGLRRFLVARKLRLEETLKMIAAHMEWRSQQLPVQVTDALIAELKKGKVERLGNDTQGRPLVIVHSGRFDPKERDLGVAIAAVIYNIEKAIVDLPAGVQQMSVFYDRQDFSFRKNWDYDFIKAIAGLLSDNYPERLGAAYIYPATAILAGLWALVKNFFDQRTREKITIITSNEELLRRVPAEFVPVTSGGTSTHIFDPSQYDGLHDGLAAPVDVS